MDARDQIGVSGETAEGTELAAVRSVFERIASAGLLEGIEELLRISHEDVELSAYAQAAAGSGEPGGTQVLSGKDAIRGFFRDLVERGIVLQVRARRFSGEGDSVAVGGSIRVTRPDGSFAETGVRWRFHFRGGLVDEVGWEPAAGG
jgi:ketosteroid isomerase-like protein